MRKFMLCRQKRLYFLAIHSNYTSLSPDSIFSIIFPFLFKGKQSSTAYNDLISCIP